MLVTLEGYAVEGAMDRPYEPATCYRPTIALGRHEGPGDGENLWRDYEAVLDLVPGLGFDGVRISIEWARVEPRRGAVDVAVLDRYALAVNHALTAGLDVTIVLVDAAWPAWLGLEAWLLPWVAPEMIAHSRRVAAHLGDLDVGVVAFSDPQRLASGGFVDATAPPWRSGASADARSARSQFATIEAALGDDDLVGAKLVRSHRSVSLDQPLDAIIAARADGDVEELYVRSLLRGAGPTAAPRGLLARRDDVWVADASPELLDALR